ncbi:MAG: cytochrome c [Methylococcales bacterium]|nr:cytochrome c [Methylococcales bacterium]
MKILKTIAFGLVIFSNGILAEEDADLGKYEFEENCASCHGITGKGDGPLSRVFLMKPYVDLTTLAKRNSGVFPVQRVYEIIDGRQEVEAHGPRTMPVWGREYARNVPDIIPELMNFGYIGYQKKVVKARIAALIDYLFRLQEEVAE